MKTIRLAMLAAVFLAMAPAYGQVVTGPAAAGAAIAGAGNPLGAGVYDGTDIQWLAGTTYGVYAQGPIASGSALHGNPVRIGASDGTDARDLRAGAYGGSDGNAITSLYDLLTANTDLRFNGTTWDRAYNNVDAAALLNESLITATETSANQTNYNGRGVKVVLNVTAITSGHVVLTINGVDAASSVSYTILTGASVSGTGTTVYTVYPGITAASNVSVSDVLPRTWNVVVTATTLVGCSYTVGASVIN